ncbi:electron transfer flavoprotein subunit alpha [Desulfonema ishimotonii]|uniref:Electron transfer flavoprotein subunit alpha n=1 Tax=Desulfonema ishimotonii TaxID=45657 RepID=A0A401FQF6_9BACT|nr:electron transfer flavoprotein subunit alpha/FixB family protein [Desulfonema ishimotonii]GBC59211.1 electron transfer flavoprotein subunit alpha [Desulfonema ishimotonii]
MERTIYVIAEHACGEISPVTFELLAFAAQIRTFRPLPISVLILGQDVSGMAEEIAASEGADITALEIPELGNYNGEVYRQVLADFFETEAPALICAGHTATGTDFAPGLAIRLGAASITNIRGVAEHETRLCFDRSICNGARTARVLPRTETAVLNVQPGVFRRTGPVSPRPGTVRIRRTEYAARKLRCTGIRPSQADPGALSDADVVVSAGNGVGDAENIGLVYRLAGLFPKSAVGGSRIVCDRGWLAYGQQVGVTGATVAPKLYIACGISGAPQHLSGMSGSAFIVAINTDVRAAMMSVADVCVTEDLATFIPTFIEACNAAASGSKEEDHG